MFSNKKKGSDKEKQEVDYSLLDAIADPIVIVNVKGVFLCCKAVLKYMIKQKGGKIINISSVAGKRGIPLLSAYCASKFAVIGFTQSLAFEVAKHNIYVNAVCPGTIYGTDLRHQPGGFDEADMKVLGITDPQKLREKQEEKIPLGRVGWPEDVTPLVLFLASDESNYIIGQAINVDGGAFPSF